MSAANEILTSHERFFVPASLESNTIFCGDEREPDTPETYLHVFGGVLNVVYNLNIMQEIAVPGSVTQSFEAATEEIVPQVIKIARAQAGVHSDDHAEHGSTLRLDVLSGPVGCGYAGLRKEISQTIVDKHASIVGRAAELQPELFTAKTDTTFAQQAVDATDRLAHRPSFLTGGRKAVVAAARQGAKSMLVHGKHVGKQGIINKETNTTLNSNAALAARLPAYDHDAWATAAINNRLREVYPFDSRQQQIAELIDTLGTMVALGVKLDDIAIRHT